MASLDQLLVLQEHDTVLDQLHHRRATLAQRAELVALGYVVEDTTSGTEIRPA